MIILVADDDRLVRFMMKSMLNEIMTSDYIILEAANGQQMLDLCRENTPDIVFADIKMPYINGVDAIEECKKYSQDTQFVIISGCSEFEYAQKALKMGVFDYLLKPVEEDQLRLVMEKLQKKIVGNKKESNSRFQLKLFNIFNYFSTVGIGEEYEEKPSDEDIIYDVIGMKSRCSKTYQEFHMEFQKDIINNINELGKEFVKRGSYYAQIYSPEGNPYFIFCSTEGKQEEILSYVKKLGWKNKNDKVAFNFVYFNKKNIKDIYFECEKLDNCIGIEMNYPTGTVNEVIADHVQEETKEILKNTFFLLNAWERVDAVAYKEVLNDMYRKYKDIETDVNLECLSQYCGLIMQREISFETYKAFCRSFVEISESMYGNVEGADLDIVGKVKSYIEKYYMNDIGIGQIAESFDITPNYLSSIFHQRAGCKFVDYLTEVRISNAKRLLVQNQTASVKDIAVMVGYSSSRYFATIFQKITGVKPSAYRKENVN